jgi:hypothetical protein
MKKFQLTREAQIKVIKYLPESRGTSTFQETEEKKYY